jgi:hypothetical protein
MFKVRPDVPKQLSKLSDECHRFSFDVVFLPIHSLLAGFPKLSVSQRSPCLYCFLVIIVVIVCVCVCVCVKVWSGDNRGTIVADLPSFSLVPQENITKVD